MSKSSKPQTKLLFVGDMHAVPEELEDCQQVIELIKLTCVEELVDAVVFLGDQHHTHAVVRLEVLHFWQKALPSLGVPVIMLVGNHDRPADVNSTMHVLEAYKGIPGVTVVDRPQTLFGIDFVPYMASEAFLDAVKGMSSPTLVAHFTADGAQYENGFFAHDGIDLGLIPHSRVISGHIHTPAELGKLTYVGAPRWRTVSDANVERSLELMTFKDGVQIDRESIDTSAYAMPIEFQELREPSFGQSFKWDNRSVKHVSVFGSKGYIDQVTGELAKLANTKVRTFVDQRQIAVKESEGLTKALNRFIEAYVAKNGTPAPVLKVMMQERLVLAHG